MLFYDTETCGFHGPITLIQYAQDDGPITLYSPWEHTPKETIKLIEWMIDQTMIGFNLEFDHFHLCQMYTTLILIDPNIILKDQVKAYYDAEPLGRDGPCLKPRGVCDLMIAAKKGKYQSTMDRRNIRIRKIPAAIGDTVAAHLEKTVKIDDIYFSRRKSGDVRRWHVEDMGDKDFVDIVLRFAPSASLKNISKDAFGPNGDNSIPDVLLHDEIHPPHSPSELGWAPYGSANPDEGWYRRVSGLPIVLHHNNHWCSDTTARRYGEQDVVLTRKLYHLLEPEVNDTDSILTCLVAASRWRGFTVDLDKIKKLKEAADEKRYFHNDKGERLKDPITREDLLVPISPLAAKRYLKEVMSPVEQLVITTTKKIVLEQLAKSELPCAKRAEEILEARKAINRSVMYRKLLTAGRFHASLKVMGTLSSRMAGGDGFNPQGIPHDPVIRSAFTLFHPGTVLSKGDFWQYEIVLAYGVSQDQTLYEDLMGTKKIHGIFGTLFYPDMTYEDILNNKEIYTRSKSGVFALFYGGEDYTLKTRLGVSMEEAAKAVQRFLGRYTGYAKTRAKLYDEFTAMTQPNGIGTKIYIQKPKDYAESLLGFRRYFTLENRIIESLFTLGQAPPKEWKQFKGKVARRDREQSIMGAAQSALYGAAFGIQSSNKRAALNHCIQSTGAGITKKFQEAIWHLQPTGVNPWVVQILNIHDELLCVNTCPDKVKQIVDNQVKLYQQRVKLLRIDWENNCTAWAEV